MDRLSRLPLECLYQILQTFAHDDNSAPLAALLQTNRHLAAVAISILYDEPYRFTPNIFKSREYNLNRLIMPVTRRIPTRALLESLPPSTVLPKVLSLGLGSIDGTASDSGALPTRSKSPTPSEASSAASPLNYLAHIRHLHQQDWIIGLDQLWKWHQAPPGVMDYILSQEFKTMCECLDLRDIFFTFEPDQSEEQSNSQSFYRILFYREANWALANPILEQLQSLSIPLLDVERYMEPSVMRRMGKLEHVHFVTGYYLKSVYQRYGEDSEEWKSRGGELREPMLQFVEEHIRWHGGVIREVTISERGYWAGSEVRENCPETIQMEIYRLLPASVKPTSLTKTTSMLQFLAHPVETDLSKVVELDSLQLETRVAKYTFIDNRHAIQRCRSLRKIRTTSLGEGFFKWALEEKRLAEQVGCAVNGSCGQGLLWMEEDAAETALKSPEYWRQGLIPLEEVDIQDSFVSSTNEVDDIAIAFSNTLKNFEIIRFEAPDSPGPSRMYVGKNWVDLPALTHLSLVSYAGQMEIDQHLLAHCPNLVSLNLKDGTLEYRHEDIGTHLPVHLSLLESLTLQGLPALIFHPATLHSTPRLTELSVTAITYDSWEADFDAFSYLTMNSVFIDPNCFIPPVEDLDRCDSTPNPTMGWTWDWDLPCLVSLTLSSEFAYLFDFRFLQHSPALQTLDLNMQTTTSSHTRTISYVDMYDPEGMQMIVLPSMTKLQLLGPWVFANASIASQFVTGMFPNLESLSSVGWIGLSLAEMIHLVKTMAKPVMELVLDLEMATKEELVELGLFELPRSSRGDEIDMEKFKTIVTSKRGRHAL
ncbi:hypothetical protein BGZ95_007608 [Linnemannia exigua]|uniref:F-box domain-containing protein n=1 Tax=Linnemannia exigua TaxID=604196 RepID=A0AAD4DGN4_9FUNG|nr:hypothetical protein BGZ95_007608 [Linnemannia exigua]